MTEAVCIDVSHAKPGTFITVEDLRRWAGEGGLSIKHGDTFLYWQNYYARQR